ncbi:hypothetical protein An02g00650 [Aspergillus niger]|uniref:Uncharacterized protein n=2 Tax=Aspergillus niger TaxID=5061 RepID=A2QBN3_ASPNC|nr:hypothetical protein An02g00650 [Aspergillus niger]CAK96280.1 hypothetical protein An02g00650 [Aspergillus niger]
MKQYAMVRDTLLLPANWCRTLNGYQPVCMGVEDPPPQHPCIWEYKPVSLQICCETLVEPIAVIINEIAHIPMEAYHVLQVAHIPTTIGRAGCRISASSMQTSLLQGVNSIAIDNHQKCTSRHIDATTTYTDQNAALVRRYYPVMTLVALSGTLYPCPGQPTLNKAPRPYIGNPAPASPEVVPCLARYSPDESRRRSMPSRFGLVPEPCPDCRPTQQTLTNQWSLRFRPCQPLIGGRTAAVRFLMGQWPVTPTDYANQELPARSKRRSSSSRPLLAVRLFLTPLPASPPPSSSSSFPPLCFPLFQSSTSHLSVARKVICSLRHVPPVCLPHHPSSEMNPIRSASDTAVCPPRSMPLKHVPGPGKQSVRCPAVYHQ